MSALGGIYAFDGARVEYDALTAMSTALAAIGPDGAQIAHDGSIGMVFRPFHTHAGSRRDSQPCRLPGGGLLCWDGRLDNHLEVATALGLSASSRESQVVSAAVTRWGIDAFARLLGDFAVALWNPRERELILATDALGMRKMLYHRGAGGIVWASLARAVLVGAGLDETVDDEFVAGFLLRHRDATRSAFRGVRHVPGGHAVRVRPERVTLHRYYRPDPERKIRYRTDAEYEEHLREVLTAAVSSTMRTDGPLYSELSGGLDSSTMVCLADAIDLGAANRDALQTVSYVYDQDFRSDERRYMAPVENQRGRRGLHIRNDDHCILRPPEYGPTFRPDQPSGQLVYLARHGHLASHMAARGARVLLRGIGGDETQWSYVDPGPPAVADLLSEHRYLAALTACRRWSLALQWPFLRTLWRGGVFPLLSRRLQARFSPYRSEAFYLQPAALLAKSFRDRADLEDRVLGPVPDSDLPLPSQRHQYAVVREIADFAVPNLCLEAGCVELRYPFFDRRLVELMLAFPLDQKLRPGETRSVQRRALRGILPEEVRKRRTKGGPGEAFHRTLLRQWPWISELLQDPLVVDYGFIDPDALRRLLQRARHGMHTGPLLRVFALEFWLHSLDRHVDDRAVRTLPHVWQQHPPPIGGSDYEDLRSA